MHASNQLSNLPVNARVACRQGRQVVVSLDSSDASQIALHWAFKHLLRPSDVLHLLCISLPTPMPVSEESMYAC